MRKVAYSFMGGLVKENTLSAARNRKKEIGMSYKVVLLPIENNKKAVGWKGLRRKGMII